MSNVFASIYEWLLYNMDYRLIFDCLYNGSGYGQLGLSLLLIPLLLFILYYWDSHLPWGNPYRKKFTWFIWLIIVAIIVVGSSYGIVYPAIMGSQDVSLQTALDDLTTGYYDFAQNFFVSISLLNGVYALLVGFLWSLLLKLKSVLHVHIPF